jgi:hypothetical protein
MQGLGQMLSINTLKIVFGLVFCLALGTGGPDFCFIGGQGEAGVGNQLFKLATDFRRTDFNDFATLCANHQQIVVMTVDINACRPGIDRIKAVDKPFFFKELKRTINGWRFGFWMNEKHGIKKLIGLKAAGFFKHEPEYLLADGRKPFATRLTELLGFKQSLVDRFMRVRMGMIGMHERF